MADSTLYDDIARIARLRGMSFDDVRAAKDAHMAEMAAQTPKPPLANAPAQGRFATAVGIYVDMEIYDELPARSRRFLQNAPTDLCAADWRRMLDGSNEGRVIRGAVRMLAEKYGRGPSREEWRAPATLDWLGMERATASF